MTNSGDVTVAGVGSVLHVKGTFTNFGTLGLGLGSEGTLDAASVVNDGSITLSADQHVGVNATLHTAGAFTNDGSVDLRNDVDKLAGPVSGTGGFYLYEHSTLNFGSSVSSGETVTFDTTRDKLILGQPSSFDGTIDDFTTAGDTVVLQGFAKSATSLLYTQTGADSCSLTLTDGANTAVLNFGGAPYTQSDFSLVSWYGGAGSAIKFA